MPETWTATATDDGKLIKVRLETGEALPPDLYFFAARLECRRGNASQVYQMLRDADPTPQEEPQVGRDLIVA